MADTAHHTDDFFDRILNEQLRSYFAGVGERTVDLELDIRSGGQTVRTIKVLGIDPRGMVHYEIVTPNADGGHRPDLADDLPDGPFAAGDGEAYIGKVPANG